MTETYVLIINWNNGPDTVSCINSILLLNDIRVMLLDNNSTDNSVEFICKHLADNSIDYNTVTRNTLDANTANNSKVLLVLSDENLGFAKGNNVLLKHILKSGTGKYAWLLNNDALANPDSLQNLQKAITTDKDIAFAGSVILDYYKPGLVQCCGVKYYKYLGISKLLHKNEKWDLLCKSKNFDNKIDYQHGASLLVKLDTLERIGLMDERFFLYSEEQDWQYTAQKMGYKNVLATESIIYHKGSVSTNNKKYLFFYHYNRSAMFFARKHNAWFVCFIDFFAITGITLIRTKLHIKSLTWGMKGLLEGLFKY